MTESTVKRLYSPLQIGAGAFLGGPLAGTQMLWSNFVSLGKDREAKLTLAIGLSVTICLLVLATFLPVDHTPTMLIPLILALAARFLSEIYQLKKEAIAASSEYVFQSEWRVALNTLLSLLVTVAFAFLIVLILSALGFELPS